jgi:hypothetical protein
MSPPVLLFSTSTADGRPLLASVVARVYRLRAGADLSPGEDAAPIIEPVYSEPDAPGATSYLVRDTDLLAPLKIATDVTLEGSAHALRGPVSSLRTQVRVGPLSKEVHVVGDRTIDVEPGGRWRLSDPRPFESMPIRWDRAYGGRDVGAEARLFPDRRRSGFGAAPEPAPLLASPRNPAGRGFFVDVDVDRARGAAAPNLEDPQDPVRPDRLLARTPLDWVDRPVAACYQPVDWLWVPRASFLLEVEHEPPARLPHEVVRGVLGRGDVAGRPFGAPPDPRIAQCAPVGLCGARLRGDEPVRLTGLHPSREVVDFHLPGERPRLWIEPPGCGACELEPFLAGVHLAPDEERVTLTWAASLEVAAEYPDDLCLSMRRAVRWCR